jgi:hypothetical protein
MLRYWVWQLYLYDLPGDNFSNWSNFIHMANTMTFAHPMERVAASSLHMEYSR